MKKLIIVLCILVAAVACKKDELEVAPLANVNLVNAVLEGKTVKLNDYLRDSALGFMGKNFSVKSGDRELYFFPLGDSLKPYFRGRFTLKTGGIYSLYLSGIPKAPDTMWVKEYFPPYATDSTMGVRLVNLSNDAGLLSLTLASDGNTNLFSGIGYKTITGYVKLKLGAVVPATSVTFQVRGADKAVLASFVLPSRSSSRNTYPNISVPESRNKNITLVVKGSKSVVSGTNAIGLFPVANY